MSQPYLVDGSPVFSDSVRQSLLRSVRERVGEQLANRLLDVVHLYDGRLLANGGGPDAAAVEAVETAYLYGLDVLLERVVKFLAKLEATCSSNSRPCSASAT